MRREPYLGPGSVAAGRRLLVGALTAGLLAACGPSVPPVEEATREALPPDRTPLVLVPGISREVGAELRGGSLAPLSALALRTNAEAVTHLGDPRFPVDGDRPLEVPAELDRALRGTDVRGLQGLIDRLIRENGYLRGDPERPVDKDYPENPESMRRDRRRMASLFVVYYDWRRDLAESACVLARQVARIRLRTGASGVYLVGHSLGGVVARYYARYGGRDVMRDRDCPLAGDVPSTMINTPGSAALKGLAILGAPNRGSALAFRALLQDFNIFGILSVGLRDAVFTMPITWQLLPFAAGDGRVPLLVNSHGEERIPLYDPVTWIARGWVPGGAGNLERRQFLDAMLARARRLHERLQEPMGAESTVPRLVIGSGCRPTLARALDDNGKVEFLSRSQDDHPMFARVTVPGDGVVSLESALGVPPASHLSALTACTRHSGYVDDPSVIDWIAQFLQR